MNDRYVAVPEAYVLDRMIAVRELCESIATDSDDTSTRLDLDSLVVDRMREAISRGPLVVLASGGADSSYLLSLAAREIKGVEVIGLMASTTGNAGELAAFNALCKELGVCGWTVSATTEQLSLLKARFKEEFGRTSRDPAQPLHNFLVRQAQRMYPECTVVDGQYADTLLFANPQNQYLDIWIALHSIERLHPRLRVARAGKKLRSRPFMIGDGLKALLCETSEVICWLSRFESSTPVLKAVDELLEKYPVNLVFQAAFFEVLLSYRERDKYLLAPDVLSPFEEVNIMQHTWRNYGDYNSVRLRKKPIWNYLRRNHPRIVKQIKSRSFEPS